MKTGFSEIAGISRIFSINTDKLQQYVREKAKCQNQIIIYEDCFEYDVLADAKASSSDIINTEGLKSSSELNFDCALFPDSESKKAFVIVTSAGEAFLMGAKEPPFVKIEVQADTSTPSEGKRKVSVKATWSSPLIRITFASPSFYNKD